MPTNKNAQLRYQILDRCFSDFHRKYFIEDLMDKVNNALIDLYGTQISIRQIRDGIKYMKDRATHLLGLTLTKGANAITDILIRDSLYSITNCRQKRLQYSTLNLYRI